jgi:hypothetical protein
MARTFDGYPWKLCNPKIGPISYFLVLAAICSKSAITLFVLRI